MYDDGERFGNGQVAPLAEIELSEHEGVRLVAVAGELDISNVSALEDVTLDLPNERLGIVLDLTATTYLDSATLGVLFKLDSGLRRRGQALRVVCTPESNARRVLDLTGFDGAYDDRKAAIEGLRADVPLRG